jgi:hypothetical protein
VLPVTVGQMSRNNMPLFLDQIPQRCDVAEVRDSGPSFCEDGTGVGSDLAEADGAPSCSLEGNVDPSYS